jgi:hypothetical protein
LGILEFWLAMTTPQITFIQLKTRDKILQFGCYDFRSERITSRQIHPVGRYPDGQSRIPS